METGAQTRKPSTLPILGLMVLIATAVFLSRSPLESSRPAAPTRPGHSVTEQEKVEARLWQDPFRVALEHEQTEHRGGQPADSNSLWKCRSRHGVEQVARKLCHLVEEMKREPNAPPVQVLLTMVRDGTFAEDHERRLRNRYAMLAALGASGLSPEDSQHIGYLKLAWTREDDLKDGTYDVVPTIGKAPNMHSEAVVAPFEWFQREKLHTIERSTEWKKSHPNNAVIMWLPESAFHERPLTRLAQVVEAIGDGRDDANDPNDRVRFDVIGPSYSGTLREMVREIESIPEDTGDVKGVDVRSTLEGLTIFSPWSTVSPAFLVDDIDDLERYADSRFGGLYDLIPTRFENKGIKFVRMIGSDDLLAMELIRELRRRGVNLIESWEPAHAALMSEYDTLLWPGISADICHSAEKYEVQRLA